MQELLSQEQLRQAVEIMQAYLTASSSTEGQTLVQEEAKHDHRRVTLIENELKPLVSGYLSGQIALPDFKTKVDGINKRNELWGFSGIKGQMFFNMLVKVADDEMERDQELKAAIEVPTNEEMALSRIKTFESYVRRLGHEHVEGGGSKYGRPKVNSVPFFLSYFWQIQQRDIWPIYYTNTISVMSDFNLWQPTGELATDYISYKRIHEMLVNLFTRESGKNFKLYDVEHVFWFKRNKPYEQDKQLSIEKEVEETNNKGIISNESQTTDAPQTIHRLPESYVPPIVAILPEMARNDSNLREAAKASGTSLERAFEKSINAAFTILGYETKLLGQGKGRVPDGLALSVDDSYAILWDAKIRGEGYSMGTDDRVIREYITTQSRDLSRRRSFRNIYYFIISSDFADDYDDAIRSIKMETDVNEVCLVEADALVAMVDARLRFPQDVSLGPDGLQRFFSVSGRLSADFIRGTLI